VVILLVSQSATATNYSWTAAVNGDFNDTTKWTPAGFPSSSADNASFLISGTYVVDLTAPQTGAAGPGTFAVNNNGNLTFDLNGNDLDVGTFNLGNANAQTLTFTLMGGARLRATTASNIDTGSSSNVTLNVTGASTNLDGVAGFMANVGSPTLAMNITSGGSITRTTAGSGTVLGNISTANVTLLVDGTNSVLSNINGISLATDGTLVGTVSNGGKIEGGLLNLANIAGNATVNVTGLNSQIRATTGNFVVGGRSTAPSNGTGVLNLSNQASGFAGTQLIVAQGASSGTTSGEVTVSGVGTTFSVGDGTSGTNALEIGFNNNASPSGTTTGELHILNGGVVTVNDTTGAANNHARVGFQASGPTATNALLHVSGSGPNAVSKLNINSGGDGLIIGGGVSSGRVEVGQYGEINTTVWGITNGSVANSSGVIALSGGTITLPATRTLTNQGTVEGYGTIARNSASGSFTLTNARTLQPGSSTTGGSMWT
jgi:hypothetical protein